MKTCSVEECSRNLHSHGWCATHWRRWKRFGDPTADLPPRPTLNRRCDEPDCDRPHEAHGLCRVHYRRMQAHGDTAARKPGKPYMGRTPEQVRARIAANIVVTESECWEWQRSCTLTGGYPALGWKGITPGHRVSYAVHIGPIPAGMWVLHHCDNPPCCNPAHLFLGTAADNHADMRIKGRGDESGLALGRLYVGERHGAAKLTDAEASDIRASTEPGVVLAERYGISPQTACNIRKGRRRRQSSS